MTRTARFHPTWLHECVITLHYLQHCLINRSSNYIHPTCSGICLSGLALELYKRQTKALEDVQRLAFQIVNNNVSYEKVCCSLNTPLLSFSRETSGYLANILNQTVRDKTRVLLLKHDIQMTGRITIDRSHSLRED